MMSIGSGSRLGRHERAFRQLVERRAALLRGIADLFEHHRQHPEPLRDLDPGKLLSHCHSQYCSHSHCHSHSHCSHSQLPCHYQF